MALHGSTFVVTMLSAIYTSSYAAFVRMEDVWPLAASDVCAPSSHCARASHSIQKNFLTKFDEKKLQEAAGERITLFV